MPTPTPKRILICAGEISGDMYGAAIVREMRNASSIPLEFYGIGGDKMRSEGVELFAHTDQTGVMGFWEVMKRYGFFSKLLKTMTRMLDTRRPDLVLTIDYPGFNLRIAKHAHDRQIKTMHYICPQVWAWHKERIPKIAAVLDKLVTIFPFEPALFDGTGLDASFAGHPLPEQITETLAQPAPPISWGEGHRIALFPGSRKSELIKLLPDELAAARLLEQRIGQCSFIIPVPSCAARETVKSLLKKISDRPTHLTIIDGNSRHVLKQAEAAVIKSGTSTLEGSLILCPFTIVYRVSTLSYMILKRLVKGVAHIGLVNILAKKTVCKELIQNEFTPEALATELEKILTCDAYRATMLDEMRAVNTQVTAPNAIANVAAEALKLL